MTDILCRWLNDDVKVAPKLSDSNFAEQFSSGYLFGEVLNKHGLQEDFMHFSSGRTSEAKLNNFMRLDPTFRLLEVPFNINLARDVMNERPGSALRLLYQLFVALNRIKKQQLNGQCLEFTRSPGRVKLEKVETAIFQERLKHQTPRQVDLNFEELIDKFKERQRIHEENVLQDRQTQAEKLRQEQRENCHKALERARETREKQNLMYAKLKPLSPTKPPQNKTSGEPGGKNTRDGRQQEKTRAKTMAVAEETRNNIDNFEAQLKTMPVTISLPYSSPQSTNTTNMMIGSTSDYVSQIKRRTNNLETGRKEREKRRRRVLVQQMTALEEQEEERRKQQLVERLMRQCQQESRIATQLMHIRRQKDTIRNNRIFRLNQFEEQRMREFQEQLDRQQVLEKQAEKDRLAREEHHLKLYKQYKKEQAELNYLKHYQHVASIMDQILDLTTKIAEYRELTENMVPAKLVHDWKTLLISGQPLYPEDRKDGDSISRQSQSTCSVPPSDVVRDTLLDETNFWQYRNAQVDWVVDETVKMNLPESHCPILTHIVYSLLDQVDPPQPPPTPPQFPKFFLRASLVGKPFSGKTTVLTQLHHQLGIVVLDPSELVKMAVQKYLSEKTLLEAQQMVNITQDEETPLINSLDNEKEVSNESINDAVSNHGDNDEEIPAVEMGNEGSECDEVPSKVEDIEEEESDVDGVKKNVSTEQPDSEDLPSYFTELSVMGGLGCKAYQFLCRGEQVNDNITVAIIIETIRNLPHGTSWILDNFPATLEQAKILSSSLTGECTAKSRFSRDFVLLPEHQMKHMELQAAAGLDLVVHLKATSETVLQRAAEHATDQGNKLDQIQHRLLSFEAGWPRLKRWLQKFRILTSINTNQDIESIVSAVHNIVKDMINKTKQHEAMMKIGVTKSMLQLSSGSTTSLPMLKKQTTTQSTKHHPLQNKITKRRVRRPSSAGAPPRIQQEDKMAPGVVRSVQVDPGDSGWEYCYLPVATEMADCLAGKWVEIERCYVTALKTAFRNLRNEREIICRYFHKRKGEFIEYLQRPDHKQELLSRWQSDFNSLPIHLHREATMKAELHCKIDDLCDKLWDICDVRKTEWETEHNRIMTEHWLEDHLGLITNTYISLMQAELVKFQDVVVLLQDYYYSIQESKPAQLPSPARVPLIELVSSEPQDPTSSGTNLAPEHSLPQQSSSSIKKKSSKVPLLPRQPPHVPSSDEKVGAGGKKKDKGSTDDTTHLPTLEDMTGLELDQQLVVHTYNTALTTIHGMVYAQVQSLISSIKTTTTLLQTPAPTTSQPAAIVEEDKKPAGKGGKGGKGSPAKKGKQTPAKKGAPDPTPPAETPAPSLSAEEREKKEQLIKAWKEHKTALQNQESAIKQRLMLIKTKAVEVIAYLKSIAAKMSEDMEVWIGKNYTQEVECVVELAAILRQVVEDEQPLSTELMIPGKTFYIEGSVVLFEEAPPSSPLPILETPPPGIFSVAQLKKLQSQLSAVAPEGFMLSQIFVDTLYGFTDNACGDFLVPDNWYGITKQQVQRICSELYGKEADYVDWRQFLVCAAQPWPIPRPHQLLTTLQRFRETGDGEHRINWKQYMTVQTWMDEQDNDNEENEVEEEQDYADTENDESGGEEGKEFNRTEKLKRFMFELFSDKDKKVDFTDMLLYLCVDSNSEVGLSKALSVVVGKEIRLNEQYDLGDIKIKLDDFYKVLTHGTHSRSTSNDSTCISKETVSDIFDRLGGGELVNEVAMNELLLDPVTVDCLDSLTSYTLTDLQAVLRANSVNTETD